MTEHAGCNPDPTTLPLPHHCYIEVSSRCNLECVFCIRPHIRSRAGRDMSVDEFAAILANLGIGDGFEPIVTLLGMGEPFMNRCLIPILEHAKTRYPQLPLSFFTNFTLPNPQEIESLVEIAVDEVIVSIECFEPEDYRKFRRGGVYERVIRNIDLLNEARNSRHSHKPACAIGFVLTRETCAYMSEAVEFAARNGMYRVYFMCCYYLSNDARSLMNFEGDAFRNAYAEASEIGRRAGVEIQFTGPRAYEYRRCSTPFDFTYIAVDGTVFPCCFTMIDPDLERWKMGNLTSESFDSIWNGVKFGDFRRLIDSGNGMCGFCPILFDNYNNVIIDLNFLTPADGSRPRLSPRVRTGRQNAAQTPDKQSRP